MIRAAVLGSDVSKSRSPAIHNAAFKALGIDGEYVARSVEASGFGALVQQLRAEGYRYLDVTIPHKDAAAALAEERGPEVRASGAANTLLLGQPTAPIRAENTDGAGLIAALADLGVSSMQFDAPGRRLHLPERRPRQPERRHLHVLPPRVQRHVLMLLAGLLPLLVNARLLREPLRL